MNLILEQGNTLLKLAVFDGDQMVACSSQADSDPSCMLEMIERYQPDKGVMSSVTGRNKRLTETLTARLSYFLWFDGTVPVPLEIEYRTVKTLGQDRIAAVAGANYLMPGQNVLVIDAGTAITYELLEPPGIYRGGNISPGMTTRFHALNRFTRQLPFVQEQAGVPFIGTDTESAIMAGVVNGIVFEMDGYIDTLKTKYGEIFVYLTGGHAIYFEKRLKNHIFAAPNLVLVGLNRILEYNAKKN